MKPQKTETNYTPAPWELKYASNGSLIDILHNNEPIGCFSPAEARGTNMANAQLISAAPDLLIALIECERSIRHSSTCKAPYAFPCSCDANRLSELAQAAIAKATV